MVQRNPFENKIAHRAPAYGVGSFRAWLQQPRFLQLWIEAGGGELAIAVAGSVVAPNAIAAAGADSRVSALFVEHGVA